jgi:hypothetical protein
VIYGRIASVVGLGGLVISNLLAQSIPNYVPSAGLVGWYPFNGNAQDASGKNNHGSVYGASLTQDRLGVSGQAYSLDGTSDYIQTDTIGALNSSSNTLSFWIQSPGYSQHHQIEYAGVNFGQLGRAFAFNSGRFANVPTPDCVNASGVGFLSLSSPFIINTWHHVVCVSDNTLARFYLNGAFLGEVSMGANICVNPLLLTLGRGTNSSGPQWFTGKFDDVGVWNRALTAAEVFGLYSGCVDSIVLNPSSATGPAGGTASFTAISSSTSATYQWQVKNGSLFNNLNNSGQFSGATASTLTVANLTSTQDGMEVRCIVDHGDCSDTTSTALLTLCSGSQTSQINTSPGVLRFAGALTLTSSSTVPSNELWRIENALFSSIPAAASTATGTAVQVDFITLNCLNFLVRKSSVSSNSSGKANILLWEQSYPIWLPAGTAVDLGNGVESINIVRYSLN